MDFYNNQDKILHDQFLGNKTLSNYLYQRLIIKSKKETFNSRSNNLFILGLARSGTTALLNQLFVTKKFASLQYKHMPFVLSPRLSAFYSSYLTSKKNRLVHERLHQDNIQISLDSPECLDEIFWIKSNLNYHKKSLSVSQNYRNSLLKGYQYFLYKHMKTQKKERMIIKNNNNFIRLKHLSDYLKTSKFIVLFRDPLSTAISLMSTNKRFCKIQKKTPYVLDYMNLIGHREFGNNFVPLDFGNNLYNLENELNTNSICFWIKYWINSYSWFTNSNLINNPNVILVSYKKICLQKRYLFRLYEELDLLNPSVIDLQYKKRDAKNISFSIGEQKIYDIALDLYEHLEKLSS